MFVLNAILAKIATALFFFLFIGLFVFCFLKIEYIFPILFLVHMVSGTFQKVFHLSLPFISFTGVINLVSGFLLLFHLYYILNNKDCLSHSLLKYFVIYLCFLVFPVVYHRNFLYLFRLGSKILSFLAIYYFSQITILKLRDFDIFFSRFLAYFFLFLSFLGLYLGIVSNFNYEVSRNVKFHFLFFEYPHSFSIFVATLVPIFCYYIKTRKISRFFYLVVFFTLPIAIYFGGAKIGVISYLLSLSVTLFFLHRDKPIRYFLVMSVVFFLLLFFISTPIYQQLKSVFSIPIEYYIENTGSYSINSFHTRIKVWVWMYQTLVKNNALWFGMGYSAWRTVYWPQTDFPSAQSDYFVALFDLGIVGFVGFLLFRFLIVYRLFVTL